MHATRPPTRRAHTRSLTQVPPAAFDAPALAVSFNLVAKYAEAPAPPAPPAPDLHTQRRDGSTPASPRGRVYGEEQGEQREGHRGRREKLGEEEEEEPRGEPSRRGRCVKRALNQPV